MILLLSLLYIPLLVDGSVAGQETLLGIVGRDFIMIGADSSSSSSIAVTSYNMDKIRVIIDPNTNIKNNSNKQQQQRQRQHSDNEEDDLRRGEEEEEEARRRWWRRRIQQQQCIVAATAGDSADSNRLLGILGAHAAVREYESGLGSDVEYISSSIPISSSFMMTNRGSLDSEAIAHLARNEIANALRSRTPLQVCLLIGGLVRVYNSKDTTTTTTTTTTTPATTTVLSQRIQQQVKEATESIQLKQQQTQSQQPVNESMNKKIKPENKSSSPPSSSSSSFSPPSSSSSFSPPSSSSSLLSLYSLEPRLYWIDEYGSFQQLKYGCHGYGSNFIWSILDCQYKPNLTRLEAKTLIQNCFNQLHKRYIINSPKPPCIKCLDINGCHLIQ